MRNLFALAFLAISACGGGQIVYPSADGSLPAPELEKKPQVSVRVDPVEGPPIPLAKLLAESVALELADDGIATTIDKTEDGQYVLKGRAESNVADREIPFVTVIHWTLYDGKGGRIGSYTQGVEGSRIQWEYGDPVIIRAVGKGAAVPIASLVRDDADTIPAAAPVRTALLVKPVSGAPSNGNQMLTRAISAAVADAGYATTQEPEQAGYVLQGVVDVDAADNGRQRVRIVWKVTTGDGREVGQAAQENTLPQESLAGPWENVAVSVVAAAFGSIEQMLEGARKYRLEGTPSGRPPVEMEPLEAPPGSAVTLPPTAPLP